MDTTTESTVVATESPESLPLRTGPDADAGGDRGPGVMSYEELSALSAIVALVAILIAAVAMGLASRAIDEHRATPTDSAGASSASVEVSLKEFGFTPSPLSVPSGANLKITNSGTVTHNVEVNGILSPDLGPGASAELDISSLTPGTYTIICKVAGHREAGMETKLTIT